MQRETGNIPTLCDTWCRYMKDSLVAISEYMIQKLILFFHQEICWNQQTSTFCEKYPGRRNPATAIFCSSRKQGSRESLGKYNNGSILPEKMTFSKRAKSQELGLWYLPVLPLISLRSTEPACHSASKREKGKSVQGHSHLLPRVHLPNYP